MAIASDLAYDLKRILDRRGEMKVRLAGTALNAPIRIASIVDGGAGTATVTTVAEHGLSTSNSVVLFGAYQTRFNGTFTITVTGATTFTFAVSGSTAGSATGIMNAVLNSALAVEDRFYSLGHIADAQVKFTANKTSKSTTGKQSTLSTHYEITVKIMQTSDVEFAAIEDLVDQAIDVAVFPQSCMTQHTTHGTMIADLLNGFLVYDSLASIDGEINLQGDDSGFALTIPFTVGKSHEALVIGA